MFNHEHNITLRVKQAVLVRWYFIVWHRRDAVVWQCVAPPSTSVSVSANHRMRNVPFWRTFPLFHWLGNNAFRLRPVFIFLLFGSLFIHLWQNTRLPHRTRAIFLSAFTFALNQPLLHFINFPPLTTSPFLPDGLFFFFLTFSIIWLW